MAEAGRSLVGLQDCRSRLTVTGCTCAGPGNICRETEQHRPDVSRTTVAPRSPAPLIVRRADRSRSRAYCCEKTGRLAGPETVAQSLSGVRSEHDATTALWAIAYAAVHTAARERVKKTRATQQPDRNSNVIAAHTSNSRANSRENLTSSCCWPFGPFESGAGVPSAKGGWGTQPQAANGGPRPIVSLGSCPKQMRQGLVRRGAW